MTLHYSMPYIVISLSLVQVLNSSSKVTGGKSELDSLNRRPESWLHITPIFPKTRSPWGYACVSNIHARAMRNLDRS